MSTIKKIIAFGNPLLDTIINITDNTLLEKYNVKEDGQKEITKEEMLQLMKDISEFEQYRSAGGCSQNMLRTLQWMLKKRCEAYIFGSVGKDSEAERLRKMLAADGVRTKYIQQDLPTGRTVSLVNVTKRTLLAFIGAAEVLPLDNLLNHDEFILLLMCSHYIYIEAFFLTNRIETAKHILDICNRNKKNVIFNICGEYIFEFETIPEVIAHFVDNANIVFGNREEFGALRKFLRIETFQEFLNKLTQSTEKLLVITDGANRVQCYKGESLVEVQPEKLSDDELKDTTGAGDAFVGGFIAGLCLEKDISECAKLGCYAASNIIKQLGCNHPTTDPDFPM